MVSPPREGLTPEYVVGFTVLLAGLALVDRTAPPRAAPIWRRFLWLGAELAFGFLVVRAHGTLVRPTLIYLLPASRALLLFGEWPGLGLSLLVWAAYGLNLVLYAWPDRLGELPGYLSFFLPLYLVAVVLTLATLRQATARLRLQALYDELAQAYQQLKALHGQARAAAVAEERNRLAREIHDSLAHYLTVINVQLEAAEKLAASQPDRADTAVRRARRLVLDCLQDVRRSVGALRASTLEELSLPHALEKLAAEFTEGTGKPVKLDLAIPEQLRLPPDTEQALYRAAQEGLTNVHKHANATTVVLCLRTEDGRIRLTVEDDGRGPPADHGRNGSGFGLLGLRERVELLGGRVSLGPGCVRGSRLEVELPLTRVE